MMVSRIYLGNSNMPKRTELGLPICNEVVQLLSGSITVKSEFGNVSISYFTLPFANDAVPAANFTNPTPSL